jgi:arylsulfatase A-like enzyme
VTGSLFKMAGRLRGTGVTHAQRGSSKRPRTFVAVAAAAVVLAGIAVAALALGNAAATTPPNILFIVTDDQRATDDTMQVMPKTLQAFRDGGTEFTSAYATTTACCPSRASIFSGRYTHNHGVRQNDSSQNLDQRFTLQHYLKSNGYSTGIYGKYFNAWNLNSNPPDFDKWAIWVSGYGPPVRMNEQGVVKAVNKYATTYVSDAAVDFINNAEANDSKPWFLDLSTTAPHSPFQPDTQYAAAPTPPYNTKPSYMEADRSDKSPGIQMTHIDEAQMLNDRVQQLRTLMSVDDMVGRVFQTLEATGEASNTIAVFISDNGYSWGEHQLEAKGEPYLESVQIPMFLRWPGHVATGGTDSRLVTNLDLPVTALDAAGVGPDIPMDGYSLLGNHSRDHVLLDFYGFSGQHFRRDWGGILTHDYQYIDWFDATPTESSVRFREYYDLNNDPFELTNLLSDGNPANDPSTGALDATLLQDLRCSGSSCP